MAPVPAERAFSGTLLGLEEAPCWGLGSVRSSFARNSEHNRNSMIEMTSSA